jgi:hypothetical protein
MWIFLQNIFSTFSFLRLTSFTRPFISTHYITSPPCANPLCKQPENHQENGGDSPNPLMMMMMGLFAYWNWLPVMFFGCCTECECVSVCLCLCVCACVLPLIFFFFSILSPAPFSERHAHNMFEFILLIFDDLRGGWFSAAILECRAKRCERVGRPTFDCPLPGRWLSQAQRHVELDVR